MFLVPCLLPFLDKHKIIDVPFYIIDVNNTKTLMGLNSCQDLNIITINTVESNNKIKDNNILEQYDNISMSELAVRVLNRIFKKCNDPYISLLEYLNTALTGMM